MLHEAGELEEAEACFRRLLAAQPDDPEALFHLGALLALRLRLDEAADIFRRALRRAPEDPHLWIRLGEVAVAQFTEKSLQEAEKCFNRAVELNAAYGLAHFALGHVLAMQDRHAESLASFQAAYRLDPESVAFQAHLLFAMQRQCEWSRLDELSGLLRRAALERPEQPPHPFNLTSIGSTPREQLACARHYARAMSAPWGADRARLGFRFERGRRERLRIGYLSAEFHEHATAYLAAELFELHDRGRFEIIAYSYGPDDRSPMRARLERAFDKFRDVRLRSFAEVATAIHADGVDILVDLKGYTFRAHPEIMSLRPAPLQVSFLGYPGTMGAEFIDYIIGDRIVTPAESAGDFAEKLVLMPDSYQVNDRRRPVGKTPSRSALGLPDTGFVFCCFNQAYKILPETFSSWMRLLKGVPGSVLWLLGSLPAAGENLQREAAARGVERSRLLFAPQLPLAEHLGRLGAADLFVDTFPYTAHTTASDALWAGLPVLTRSGDTFASRVAASLLAAAGVPELVTRTPEEFEALGLRLARSPAELRALREKVAKCRSGARLFDTPRWVRNLELAYEGMWSAYGAGAPPKLIEL